MRFASLTVASLVDSKPRLIAATLASGAIAGVGEYVIHTAVTGAQLWLDLPTLLDSGIMATITAVLMYIALRGWRVRRMLLLQRLLMVAELNHNVRNALQMLLYSPYLPPKEQTQAVLESVDRIESTLKELFPSVVERTGRVQHPGKADIKFVPHKRARL